MSLNLFLRAKLGLLNSLRERKRERERDRQSNCIVGVEKQLCGGNRDTELLSSFFF